MIRSAKALLFVIVATLAPAVATAKPTSVFLEDMTTSEVRARLDAGCSVGIIFNGGGEASGPALALGKHLFRARAYGEAIARNIGDAIVAPIQPFAPNGGPNGDDNPFEKFAGTISITNATFSALNEQIARSLIAGGFRRIALFGDHGDGQAQLRDLAGKLDAEFSARGIRIFYIGDGYSRARKQIEDDGIETGRLAGGHGGLWDTAETLAVRRDAVRMDKLASGDVSSGGNGELNTEGFAGDARPSTVAIGREFGAIRVRLATEELRRALSMAGECKAGSP